MKHSPVYLTDSNEKDFPAKDFATKKGWHYTLTLCNECGKILEIRKSYCKCCKETFFYTVPSKSGKCKHAKEVDK
jgi:hypothetical protein